MRDVSHEGTFFMEVCCVKATYEEQMEKLREHGCEITDEAHCKEVLSQIGYYRLSAYFLPFRTIQGKYKPDTTFAKVYNRPVLKL